MEGSNGKFKIIKKTSLDDLNEGKVSELPESDLCIQTSTHIVQYEYIDVEDDSGNKLVIKPGVWTIANSSAGLTLRKIELRTHNLLETASNTFLIQREAKIFFSKLDIYKKFKKDPKRAILLYSQPGMGKCLHPEQGVLMFNGSIKKAKDIRIDDLLMGPDSTPRKVVCLHAGEDEMFKITPTKGNSYIVNSNHVLSLKNTDTKEIVNISVKDYLDKSENFKIRNKGYRSDGVEFDNKNNELPIDPYILGLWLGDGSSGSISLTTMDQNLADIWIEYGEKFDLKTNIYAKKLNKASTYHNTTGEKYGSKNKNKLINLLKNMDLLNNKHIPEIYKTSSKENRLLLLAGLIDSDGHLTSNCYEISQKNTRLSNDIEFVARSLGLAAFTNVKFIHNERLNTEVGYNRTYISGNIDKIPVKLDRKKATPRKQIKDVLMNGITVEPIGKGEYRGFTIDSDNLFLLEDFTVTHNSSTISKISSEFIEEDEGTVVIFWDTSDIGANHVSKLLSTGSKFSNKCTRMLFVMEDIGGGNAEDYHGPKTADASLLELLDGASVSFKLPTFIIATTNTPENLLKSLADRPGRFDQMFELEGPNGDERVKLAEHIAGFEITQEQKDALLSKDADGLSIAHISEIIIRSELHDKTFGQVIKEMKEHKKKIELAFQKAKGKMGIGLS